jgi:hypothetical protein
MKRQTIRTVAILSIGLLVSQSGFSQGTVSSEERTFTEDERALLAGAFHSAPQTAVEALDDSAMNNTRGELWPWIIGVAALDISLASFFWGTYVPTVTGSGTCPNCNLTTSFPR